jgi:hypothetical protein
MMSVDMRRAMAEAERLDGAATPAALADRRTVLVVHEDGSVFLTDSACVVEWKDPEVKEGSWGADPYPGEWVLVIAEHHLPRAYPKSEVLWTEFCGPARRGGGLRW